MRSCASIRLIFFDTGQALLVDFDLCAPTRLVFFTLVSRCCRTLACALAIVAFFDTGQSLLVDFGLCAPTRLIFLILVSRCWWTLTFALPLDWAFSHWSAAVGGLWLVCFHSYCLFDIGFIGFFRTAAAITAADRRACSVCQKDKTSGNAQVNVHQQRLTSVKKIRRLGAHKPKSAKVHQQLLTSVEKEKTSGVAQVKFHQ